MTIEKDEAYWLKHYTGMAFAYAHLLSQIDCLMDGEGPLEASQEEHWKVLPRRVDRLLRDHARLQARVDRQKSKILELTSRVHAIERQRDHALEKLRHACP